MTPTWIVLAGLVLSHAGAWYVGYLVGDGRRFRRLLQPRPVTKFYRRAK